MSEVKDLVERSRKAQEQFAFATQEQADAAAKAICKVIFDNAAKLGPMAAEDTGMGDPDDKISKCRNKSALIWNDIKDKKTVGVIERNEELRMLKVAKPMGVVASIIPATNPVVTPMSNAAFALKTRNSIIFSPHPRAIKLTKLIVDMFRAELKKLGLPEDLVLGVEKASIEASAELMSEADVIVATGGMAMVKAAYSSGKPAYGVGQGNVQCIVDDDVDIEDAAKKVIAGRAFDCGLICLGEQTVFVPNKKLDEFIAAMERNGAHLITDKKDVDAIRESLFPNHGPINRDVVGKTAIQIADKLGLNVPAGTKVIAVKVDKIGKEEDLCREKMAPIIAVKGYDTFEEGIQMVLTNLDFEGKGHSISIHSNNAKHVEYAGIMAPVSRVVVNQPSGTTGGGSPTNGFIPTTTLGCGSWGNNSFSGNFTYKLLLNATRVGYPFEKSYLPNIEDAFN